MPVCVCVPGQRTHVCGHCGAALYRLSSRWFHIIDLCVVLTILISSLVPWGLGGLLRCVKGITEIQAVNNPGECRTVESSSSACCGSK